MRPSRDACHSLMCCSSPNPALRAEFNRHHQSHLPRRPQRRRDRLYASSLSLCSPCALWLKR
jgi:hypothetical protein